MNESFGCCSITVRGSGSVESLRNKIVALFDAVLLLNPLDSGFLSCVGVSFLFLL